jgi:predicted RecA/RadA family phage recombinase
VSAGASWSAVAIHPGDSVAVVLRDVAAGESIAVRIDGRIRHVIARDAIALGHKMATVAIAKGASVLKYGAEIALATSDIAEGQHVHVHNVASNRAKKAVL